MLSLVVSVRYFTHTFTHPESIRALRFLYRPPLLGALPLHLYVRHQVRAQLSLIVKMRPSYSTDNVIKEVLRMTPLSISSDLSKCLLNIYSLRSTIFWSTY